MGGISSYDDEPVQGREADWQVYFPSTKGRSVYRMYR